jgi:hypothetical protein
MSLFVTFRLNRSLLHSVPPLYHKPTSGFFRLLYTGELDPWVLHILFDQPRSVVRRR